MSTPLELPVNNAESSIEKNLPLSALMNEGCQDCPDASSANGKPCCDDPDFPAEDDTSRPWVARLVESAFYRAMELCFDELTIEPKRILLVGGCRQRDYARRLGFLLPFCKIVALDPERAVVEKAREEVACRFRFEESALESLPYNTDGFDFTIVHNLAEFTDNPKKAIKELGRVTKHHLLVSHHRSLVWALLGWLPGMKMAMKQLGCQIPFNWQHNNDWETALFQVAETQLKVAPLPWDMRMTQVKKKPEGRTQLN